MGHSRRWQRCASMAVGYARGALTIIWFKTLYAYLGRSPSFWNVESTRLLWEPW